MAHALPFNHGLHFLPDPFLMSVRHSIRDGEPDGLN